MADLSNLKPEVKQWWESLCAEALEQGIDLMNSPTDRMLLEKIDIETFKGKPEEVFKGAFLKKKYSVNDEYGIYNLEDYIDMYDEPTVENVTALYDAAKLNNVALWKKNAESAGERGGMGDDFYRLVGVKQNGSSFISKTLHEINSDHDDGPILKEFEDTIGGSESGRDNIISYMTLTDMSINDLDAKSNISSDKISEFMCKPDISNDERAGYHSMRLALYSNNCKNSYDLRYFAPQKAEEELHHYIAEGIENDIKIWTGTTQEDLDNNINPEKSPIVYDSKMRPVDFNDKARLMIQIKDGLYIYKPGETEPHTLEVLPKSGIIKYSTKPIVRYKEELDPVTEPYGITKFFHKVAKFFGGKGFDSCIKYEAYLKDKEKREAIDRVKEVRKFEIEESNRKQQKKDERVSARNNAKEIGELMQQKFADSELNPEVKRLFEHAAQKYNNFAEGKLNVDTVQKNSDVSLATIFAAHMLLIERSGKGPENKEPGDIENAIINSGAKDFVQNLHKTAEFRKFVEECTPEKLNEIMSTKGSTFKNHIEAIGLNKSLIKQKSNENVIGKVNDEVVKSKNAKLP